VLSSGRGLQVDGVAEGFELADQVTDFAVGIVLRLSS
jgi:hypothetical protein